MKDPVAKIKTFMALLGLTLLFLPSRSQASLNKILWKIEALEDRELGSCSDNLIAEHLLGILDPEPDLLGRVLVAYFPAATGSSPSVCVQMAADSVDIFGTDQGTFYVTSEVEQNTASDVAGTPGPVLNTSAPYQNKMGFTGANGGEDLGTLVDRLLTGQIIAKGMVIVLHRARFSVGDPGEAYYYFKNYGGWIDCHGSCETCRDVGDSGCTACKSWASRKGPDIDSQRLVGRCFCPVGGFDQALTGCDTSACHSSCKNCEGPTESDCIECADGLTPMEKFFPRKCVAEGGITCHESCQNCDSTGKCLTCKSVTGGPLTPINNECRCPAGKFLVTGENR